MTTTTEYWPIPWPDKDKYCVMFMRCGKRDLYCDFIEWWNVSRRHRHGKKAVWTQRAFNLSMQRVLNASELDAERLVQAGIEHGWQALKPEYLKPAAAPTPWQM